MARGDEVLDFIYDEDIKSVRTTDSSSGSIQVFYNEGTGNTTFTQAVNWDEKEPKFLSLYNSGATALTVEVNSLGSEYTYTIKAGEAKGAIGYDFVITNIGILASDTFELWLSK